MTLWQIIGAILRYYMTNKDEFQQKNDVQRVFLNGQEIQRNDHEVDVDFKLSGIIFEKVNIPNYQITGRYPYFTKGYVDINGQRRTDGDIDLKMDNLDGTWLLTHRIEWREGATPMVLQLFTGLKYSDLIPYKDKLDDVIDFLG